MLSYLVFDFETSGLGSQRHRIIQVGICRVVNGQVAERAGWLVNQNVEIDPNATRIHGLTTDKLKAEGISPHESLDRLLAYLRDAPKCVGHNIHEFDIPFLLAECQRLGRDAPQTHGYVDTAAHFKGWKIGVAKSPLESEAAFARRVLSARIRGLRYSIPTCMRELRLAVPTTNLHNASQDAYVTHLIYEALQRLR